MHASELWHGNTLAARLARTALTPLGWLYAAGWQGYLAVYRFGFKKAQQPHPRIVCIGNLQAGGLGKTPFTIATARLLTQRGHQVVVGCSGYGSPRAEAATLAPEGPLDPSEWGDEPAMIRSLLPEVPLVVGRRRVLAAELVHARYPDSILVMDDGFQHLPLRKSVSIVLDVDHPTNSRCLPAGPYREPRSNRSRADLVVPGTFRVTTRPTVFTDLAGHPATLEGPYQILTAIGRPEGFLASLAAALPGQPQVHTKLKQDHDPLQAGNLFDGFDPALPIVVTAKDAIKLQTRNDLAGLQLRIAQHQVSIEPENEFAVWLEARLNGETT